MKPKRKKLEDILSEEFPGPYTHAPRTEVWVRKDEDEAGRVRIERRVSTVSGDPDDPDFDSEWILHIDPSEPDDLNNLLLDPFASSDLDNDKLQEYGFEIFDPFGDDEDEE